MLCDFLGHDQQYQENYLSKYYKKTRHNVVIIASTFESIHDYYNNRYKLKTKKIEEFEGAKIIRLPYSLNIMGKIKKFNGVRDLLLKEKPDMVFAHGLHLNLNDAVWYKKKINNKCRIVCDSHADFSNSGNNWISLYILNGVLRRLHLQYYKKHIDKLYAVVPEGMKFMNEIYGVSYSEMELLPLGCDYDLSEEIRNRNVIERIKEKYKIAKNDFVIFTGGKLHKSKKTDILIDSIKLMNNMNAHLLIVGSADIKDLEYESYLKNNSKGYNIDFMGWLKPIEILEVMYISDIAVFPSSQSVMWQQAIGMHLPLIVGNSGSQDATYLNKNNNVIVLTKQNINSEKISELIKELLNNPDKLLKMRLGAKKTAEEFLNYDIIARRTLE